MKFTKLKIYLLPALLAAAWFGPRAEAPAKQPDAPVSAPRPRVEVADVKRLSSVQQGINTTSTLQALEEVILNPKVTGRIDNLVVAKGDLVEAGDTLVVLDSRNQEAEYNSMQAQVAVSKAELSQSAVTLADAKRELDRYGRLRKSGYATQQEYDTRSTTYQAAVAANAKAAAQVKQAQANLDAQAVLLSEYQLTLGALVKDATNVLRIGRVDRLKARVDIPERDMGRLRLGMDAVLTFESLSGQTFYGTVTLIDPYINISTRTIGAEITVDNQATGFKLRPGMFARVLLVETSEENPLVIPTEALRADGSVMVIRDGKAAIQKVVTGAATGGMVTVSDGLQIGEDVVVSGGNNVAEGTEVDFVITAE